ncbi:hypothetical protein Taro_008882 [Colocasia esculenta]|uniref:Uncharacterized protein n=1 Tax=Colocasia esculenta TaxID=4460 RepID=A0A843U4R7_COLES|nr:hypothetical protein [Colocasia esculenta]
MASRFRLVFFAVRAGFGVTRHRWGCRSVWAPLRVAGVSRWFLGLVLQSFDACQSGRHVSTACRVVAAPVGGAFSSRSVDPSR